MDLLLGRNDAGDVRLKPEALLRHVACLGSSGSGKTVACKVLCEEVIRAGVPVIAIDPQGDIASFACPPEPEAARQKGVPEAVIREFREKVDPVIWTPGTSHGIGIALDPLRAAPAGGRPEEVIRDRSLLAASLAGLIGLDPGDDDGRAATAVIDLALESFHTVGGRGSGVAALASTLDEPSPELREQFTAVAAAKVPGDVARRLRILDVGASRLLFSLGAPLSIDTLLGHTNGSPGRTRLSVIYLNGLPSQEDKEFFVSVLVQELYRWMLQHPSRELQALFYMDEVAPFLPPVRKPACKDALKLLLKQARKYGVGCLLATQNPGDVDYTALGQLSTWNLGRLLTRQDLKKVEGVVKSLDPAGSDEVMRRLPALSAGEFVLLAPDSFPEPVPYRVRWLVSAHQTLDEEGIARVTRPALREKLTPSAPVPGGRGAAGGRDEPAPPASESERVRRFLADAKGARTAKAIADGTGLATRAVSGALKALADDGTIVRGRMKGGELVWLKQHDLRPDLGLTELLQVARLEIREPQARAAAGGEAQRSFLGLRADETLGRLLLRHYPLWQVHLQVALTSGWIRTKVTATAATIYLDPYSGDLWGHERKRGFFTVPAADTSPVDFEDLDDVCTFDEVGPGTLDLHPAALEGMMDAERAAVLAGRKFDAKVLRTALVFLPYWVGELQAREGGKRLVWIDGVRGRPLTLPARPMTADE